MVIDERLKDIIETIENRGHQCLIVGGAVRNYLLNLKIKDYDLATSASLSEVSELFLHSSLIYRDKCEWALKVDYKGFKCEVSSFRMEKDYVKRIPQTIIATDDFKVDVLRRDFTINALGYSLKDGYLDYIGGLDDLKDKVVRVIGLPSQRFKEDPMRILRGLRLASTLNFTIEQKTLKTIKKMYDQALKTSSDHLAIELKRIISGDNFDYVYDNVKALFLDISNNCFINIKLKDRTVLMDDEVLFVYLIYILKFDDENPIFKYLDINKKTINKMNKDKVLIEMILSEITYQQLVILIIDYGINEVDNIFKILNKLDLLNKDKNHSLAKIKKNGYLKIGDLNIKIEDLSTALSLKEKYAILTCLQKQVILKKVENKPAALKNYLKTLL
ncbi:MAG: CCA tRNA nucleotidyltransferase [Erysipelothrix sp.]|nr:CCA tRNA nucleotidyltransferase [Erysipelothrix sp.]